jgi:hypothetical protein
MTYGHLTQTATIDGDRLTFLGADQTQLWDAGGYIYQDNLLGLGFHSPDMSLVRDPDTGSLISQTSNGDKRFILHDGRNSTIGLLSPPGDLDRTYAHDPFGCHREAQGPADRHRARSRRRAALSCNAVVSV